MENMTPQQKLVRRQTEWLRNLERMLKETNEANARIKLLLDNQPGQRKP